jgi:large subunit ribosomal protein L19
MSDRLIALAEQSSRRPEVPQFRIGDTVTVNVKIVEGDKERIQPFTGVVIGRRGSGVRETFTVRRIVANEGVERIFPIHSPKIISVQVHRSGKVRRAKLYYLRERVGKARKLRERRTYEGRRRGVEAATAEPSDADAEVGEPEPAARS